MRLFVASLSSAATVMGFYFGGFLLAVPIGVVGTMAFLLAHCVATETDSYDDSVG